MAEDTTAEKAESTGTGSQLFMGLLWLGITVWSTHQTLTSDGSDATGILGTATAALPDMVATTLLTSASIASAASSRFAGAFKRLLMGTLVGVLFGLISFVGLRFAYGETPSINVLATVVAIAGVLGGLLAILPNGVLEAALWSASWVFFAGLIFGVLKPQVMLMLNGGPKADLAHQASADLKFFYGTALATGLIAAFYSARTLHLEKAKLLWYFVGGALPGLFLLASETLTRLGGASLVKLVNTVTDSDVLTPLTDAVRLRHSLIVIGVGTFLAVLAGIRNIRKDAAEEAREAAEEARRAAEEAEEEAREAAEEAARESEGAWEVRRY